MSEGDVTFYFEGRKLKGRHGEPIAKALFRAGVKTLSYSVKYKRPRGIHCARGRCVMCHMAVDGIPGVPTCITPLEEGMCVERENYQPFFAPLLTAAVRLIPFKAGFYYRMFNRPRWVRRFFLHNIRKVAGVGRIRTDIALPATKSPQSTGPAGSNGSARAPLPAGRYDIVVVGAGISGLIAAAHAEHHGARLATPPRIVVVDEYATPGGHSLGHQTEPTFAGLRDSFVNHILTNKNIHYHPNTTALGFYPPDTLLVGPGGSTGFAPRSAHGDTMVTPRGVGRIRAKVFVFATGAYDVVPIFKSNDTPGIFGPRAIRLLLERDGLKPGRNAIVYGTGEPLARITALLRHHGVNVAGLVNPSGEPDRVGDDQIRGRVVAARGRGWLTGVTVESESGGAGAKISRSTLGGDMLCIAFPGQPAYELPYQAGFTYTLSREALDEDRVLKPETTVVSSDENGVCVIVAGEAAGITDTGEKLASGYKAGRLAVEVLES